MDYAGYGCLSVGVADGVATVTLDHPPINLFDATLMGEIARLSRELADDDAVRVVVMRSANPEFFIAHADVTLIQTLPTQPPQRAQEVGGFHAMVDRFRTMPKATIAQIEGIARGGGSELLLSFDMRFGARGKALLGQPEVALGILPGGSGTQRLPRLLGRGRALEVILGCEDFDADLAERYGWLNRALDADEIGPFVERLARRIASYPAESIALAKRAAAAAESPPAPGLIEEADCFNHTLALPEAQRRMARFMEAGGQTREGELDLQAVLAKL